MAEELRWIPAMRETYARRLGRFERQVEQRLPGVLQRLTEDLPVISSTMPSWCPLPIAAVIAAGVPVQFASAVTAVAAWRMAGRHVVYIHPDQLPGPIDHVPVQEMQRLPVRCVYLATSDADGQPPSGLLAWLEYDLGEKRTEVRMQIDLPAGTDLWATLSDPVHAVRGSLRDAVSATQTTAIVRAISMTHVAMPPVGRGTDLDALIDQKTRSQSHLLAAVAYLSAPKARVVDATRLIDPQAPARQWAAPGTDSPDVTLWLAT